MGTSVAVCFANIFVHSLEERMRTLHPCLFNLFRYYKRYIDDTFGLFTGTRAQFTSFVTYFNELCPSINLTYTFSHTTANLLDITIFKGPLFTTTSILDTRPFEKPLNNYLYVPATSGHTLATKRGFIKGEAIRYARFSSDFAYYRTALFNLRKRLNARGYSNEFITQR